MNASSILLAIPLLLTAIGASASPLRLDYTVSGSGVYHYDFNLIMDNHDSSWGVGQTVSWIVFGDSPTTSPLNDFVGDLASLPIGPFVSYTTTSGDHNGPSLSNWLLPYNPNLTYQWSPTTVGENLHWSGTSANYLGQGQLQFSTLAGTMRTASFDDAHLQTVPVPAAAWLLGSGLLGLIGVARRKVV